MQNHIFDANNTLSGKLSGFLPREAIDLGISLCQALENAVGSSGCHGSICPQNISITDKNICLAPKSSRSINEMGPDELEYIAPEQFWNGESVPQSDVYSIGLVLYTALNEAAMPFHDRSGGAALAEMRAGALQRRMNGETPGYPKTACRELGEVVRRAISFKKENRYKTAAELCAALAALPESSSIPAVAPVLAMTSEEILAVKNYKVDKNFEKTEPPKPKKAKKEKHVIDEDTSADEFRNPPKNRKTWIVPVGIIVAVIIIAFALLKGCGGEEPRSPVAVVTAGQPTPEITPESTPDAGATPEPTVTDEPDPSPELPEPEDPDDPADTLPTYELVMANVSWREAVARCEEMGGHLVTIRNDAELAAVIEIMENSEAKFLWLGASRGEDGLWYYVTGERMTYAVWEVGEPSVLDGDGTPEDYLIMWKSRSREVWCFNDTRNDPVSLLPATYGGFTAFICQFD